MKTFIRSLSVGMLFIFFCSMSFSQMSKFQAAYIYNFTRYIEWPEEYKTGDFVICVLGQDDIVKDLKDLAVSKKVSNQKIDVVVVDNTSSIPRCQVFYVPTSKSGKVSEVSQKLRSQNTLIITNSSNGISSGAAINFFVENNKLQFEMKTSNIELHGIKVNSALENLARKTY